MTLSGNIEAFPLSEVLRLAARSNQSGLLRVESGGTHGASTSGKVSLRMRRHASG